MKNQFLQELSLEELEDRNEFSAADIPCGIACGPTGPFDPTLEL